MLSPTPTSPAVSRGHAAPKDTPLPEATLRPWLCQMLLALEYLQCCRVLHRDIKAANLLLTAAGDVQLGARAAAQGKRTPRLTS